MRRAGSEGMSITYLGQKVIAPCRQRFVAIALQRGSCQGDNDDGRFEHGFSVFESVFAFHFLVRKFAIDTAAVQP